MRGLSVIPSPRMGGMVQCDKHAMGEINQTGRSRRAGSGIMTTTIRAHRGFSRCSPRPGSGGSGRQAADVVIAQAVEH